MINNVFLLGRLGERPEVRIVGDKRVATLSVATWENHKKGEEWVQAIVTGKQIGRAHV